MRRAQREWIPVEVEAGQMPGRHMRTSDGPYDLSNRRPTSHPQQPNRSHIDTLVAILSTSHESERSTGLVLQNHLVFISRRTNHLDTEQLHSSRKRRQGVLRINICLPSPRQGHRDPLHLRKRCQIAHTLHSLQRLCLHQNSRPSRSHRRVISEPFPRLHSPATVMISSSARQHNPWWECKVDDD